MKNRSMKTNGRGFSLIEILIAVVILSTGFLALTALQGRLAQASAEAKVRSRVAAMLTSRMDALRAGAYENSALVAVTNTCSGGAPVWLCDAQTESGITGLSVGQAVSRYSSAVGANTFLTSGGPAAAVGIPEFKRIVLTATWTDAAGAPHNLGMSSDLSELALSASLFPSESGGSAGISPLVRQDSPATDGVIPLTVGNEATAASNPRPEILEGQGNSRDIVGTRFDVLTYQGNTGAALIQRRIETSVIQCSCRYGNGGATNLGAISATPQWPVAWDGQKYRLIKTVNPADSTTNAPGAGKNAGPTDVDQSALCTECCRDHHDLDGSTPDERFDPQRSAPFSKFQRSGATFVAATTDYVDACRLVRVDGFWRTATDMYARHFGLLPTKSKTEIDEVGGVASVLSNPATSGVPRSSAVKTYETFVKSYLAGIAGTSSIPPTDADTRFANYASIAAQPTTIGLNAAPDMRYLHARGLYVDYLSEDAKKLLIKALANKSRYCPDATSDAECVLLYLPLSTINLTEIANWGPRFSASPASAPSSVVDVNNDRAETQIWDPIEPTRGSTRRDAGTAAQRAFAVAMIGKSNAGVAVAPEIDAFDVSDVGPGSSLLNDAQEFTIGTVTNSNEPKFYVLTTGLLSDVTLALSSNLGSCSGTPKGCVGIPDDSADHQVTLTVTGYNANGPTDRQNNPCGNGNVLRPQYRNYALSDSYRVCSDAAGTASCQTLSSTASIQGGNTNDGRKDETSIKRVTVSKGRYLFLTFTPTAPPLTQAGYTCSGSGNQATSVWTDLGYGW